MATLAVFVFYVLTHFLLLSSAESCPAFFCNEIVGDISFPFKNVTQLSPTCGYYNVNCSDRGASPKIQLKEGGYWFEFEGIPLSASFAINDGSLKERIKSLEGDNCDDAVFNDLSLPKASSPIVNIFTHNLTLFRCSNTLDNTSSKDPHYACKSVNFTYYTVSNDSLHCPPIQIPIIPGYPTNVYDLSALTSNFPIQVHYTDECTQCNTTGGKCFDVYGKFECNHSKCLDENGQFICSPPPEDKCWDEKRQLNCSLAEEGKCWDGKRKLQCANRGGNLRLKLGLGLGLAGGVLGPLLLVLVVLCLRRKLSFRSIFFWKTQNQNRKNLEAFLRNYGPLQVKRYSYLDVEKMTNSFEEKLGQGGFGGVYKGKLKGGPLVAVKVLNRPKGNGEDFMNEVGAISRTSHVNIVGLLGFCFEGSKRALIYEFMPNGSLEKFIFDAKNLQNDHHLGWEALEQISLGIAQGLEYLHRGCNTRILHFDIKPHNILLDENFSPKISDFGLAKICDRKESIVSMSYLRGTAGYIAPEVFCRNFGGVSHKSDVYSYGMLLSKIVGGRSINDEVEDTSEIYFPHWIYKRLEQDEELGLQRVTNEEDKARARKLIIVSLWCIQTDPSNRPAMKEVIEMLEGSVESLQIPPKPSLSSPPKYPAVADSSSTLVSI